MTNQEIMDLAKEAAQSAIDAHGVYNIPSADIAYDFIRNMKCEEEKSEELACAIYSSLSMTHQDFALFSATYKTIYETFLAAYNSLGQD